MKLRPLEEKIGQMLIVGFHGTTAPQHILEWLKMGKIGGVILFARNIETPTQVEALTRSLHEAAKYPILIAIDQEGGTVARLRTGYTESPGAMALGAADDPELSERVSGALASELRALGINWNLAPAIDLTHNIHNPSVGTRSIGTDPDHVSRHAVAQVKGFQSAGVAATAKHFPGKANTPVDPHVELPVIEGRLDDMWMTDLVPFRAACEAGVAAILITHVQFKDIEPTYPSTMSKRIIGDLLRDRMGYRGLVTTDCMEMKAVTLKYGPGESAVLAALAGANTLLFSHTREYQEEVYDALLSAALSGRLPMEQIDYSVERIQEMKKRYPAYPKPDLDVIRSPEHLSIALRAAKKSIIMHKTGSLLPLKPSQRVALIEFASHIEKEALQPGSETIFAGILRTRLPFLESTWLDPVMPTSEQIDVAETIIAESEIILLATRNAHISPVQRTVAEKLINKKTVLVCLRNPYDAGVFHAETILLTLGDSYPSMQAASMALLGELSSNAKLPVPLTMGS